MDTLTIQNEQDAEFTRRFQAKMNSWIDETLAGHPVSLTAELVDKEIGSIAGVLRVLRFWEANEPEKLERLYWSNEGTNFFNLMYKISQE